MKIFTRAFFRLSPWDQAAIVDSVNHDLESAHFVDRQGRQKAARKVRRITKKAIEYGVYAAEEEGEQ